MQGIEKMVFLNIISQFYLDFLKKTVCILISLQRRYCIHDTTTIRMLGASASTDQGLRYSKERSLQPRHLSLPAQIISQV